VRAFAWLPATRRTWTAATIRIVQNEATLHRLPIRLHAATYVLNHAPLVEMMRVERRVARAEVLSLGALDSRKGVNLAIRALIHAPRNVRLVVVGDGPQRRSLEALARKLGVADRVEFRGRVKRAVVLRLLEEASAAVFVGLREEGGIALAEAMLCGVPVIVLAHGGPRTIAAGALDPSRVALIPADRPAAVARQIGEAMARFCGAAGVDVGPNLDPDRSRGILQAACREALEGGVHAHGRSPSLSDRAAEARTAAAGKRDRA
jgi:glycosyltransferase involved in cell wall biosynthesis